MTNLTLTAGQTAVITGAGSGFGLALARLGAQKGLNLVLADVQQDVLAPDADRIDVWETPHSHSIISGTLRAA